MFELKRVTDKQLKEIVMLQKEIEAVRCNSSGQVTHVNTRRKNELDNAVWAKTEDAEGVMRSPRRQSGSSKQIAKENDALQNERNQLLQLCGDLENQIKDSHKSLEESLIKIIQLENDMQGKDKEIEEIRRRVTEVAELFEKKEIKQRYSFEVLCDFVYDKAKRLFTKFENAMKELKNANNGIGGGDKSGI
jgi:hypothetical protein